MDSSKSVAKCKCNHLISAHDALGQCAWCTCHDLTDKKENDMKQLFWAIATLMFLGTWVVATILGIIYFFIWALS